MAVRLKVVACDPLIDLVETKVDRLVDLTKDDWDAELKKAIEIVKDCDRHGADVTMTLVFETEFT